MRSGIPSNLAVNDALRRLEVVGRSLPDSPQRAEFEQAWNALVTALKDQPAVEESGTDRNGLAGRIRDLEEELRATEERASLAAEASRERERLTQILEGLTEGFIALDREWRFTYVTRRGAQHSGRPPEELIGKSIWEVYPKAVGTRFDRELTRAARDQVRTEFEEYYPAFNAWYEIRVYPYRDGLTVYTHDITPRKRAEDALRETQEFVTGLLENAPCAVFVTTRDHRYRLVNRAWETFLELGREEVIGRTRQDCLSARLSQPFDETSQRVLDTGRPLTVDQEVDLPTGHHVFHTVKFPLLDGAGRVEAVGGIALDITERRFAEEASRQSEERFRVMAEMVPDVLFTAREDGAWDYVNPRFFDCTGLGMAESLGFGWTAALHPEEGEKTASGKGLVAAARDEGIEIRLRAASGHYRWFFLRSRAIERSDSVAMGESSGRILRWFGAATDIDDRKRAEDALRESEERLRFAQACANAGTWDRDMVSGRVVWSEAYYRLCGLDRNRVEPSYEGWLATVHPEDRAHAHAAVLSTIEHRRREYRVEYRIVHPEKGVRWLGDLGRTLFDRSGRPLRMAGISIDITERKRAEEEVRKLNAELERRVQERTTQLEAANQELAGEIVQGKRTREVLRVTQERLAFLLSAAPAVIYAGKPSGDWAPVFISENLRLLLGYDPRDFTNNPRFWLDHVHPDDQAGAAPDPGRLLKDGQQANEYRFLHRDGTYRWLHNSAKLVRDADGHPVEFVGCWIDISDRKRDQARILQSERLAAIGEAMAGLSHESRNALQRSKACLAMLALDLRGNPEALDLISRAQGAQDRLHALYEQVRHYAAPVVLSKQTCHLGRVAQQAWDDLALAREGRIARLRESGDEPDLHLAADPHALGQVFRNIFENALAACADPVEVVIHWSRARLGEAPAVRIAIRDNGPGLTPEVRRRIFEAFFTTKTHGTGLGMAIAKRIVEAHGGRIALGDSSSSGAEFLITLPRGTPTPDRIPRVVKP